MLYNLTFVNKRITAKYSQLYIIVSSDFVVQNNPVTSIFVQTPRAGHWLHLLLLCRYDDAHTTTIRVQCKPEWFRQKIHKSTKRSEYYYIAIYAKCVFFTCSRRSVGRTISFLFGHVVYNFVGRIKSCEKPNLNAVENYTYNNNNMIFIYYYLLYLNTAIDFGKTYHRDISIIRRTERNDTRQPHDSFISIIIYPDIIHQADSSVFEGGQFANLFQCIDVFKYLK